MAKIANAYIVDDLDYWPRHPLNNFVLKNYFFIEINIVKNSDKSMFTVAIE